MGNKKYSIIPEFDNYAISTDLEVINRFTGEVMAQHDYYGTNWVNLDGVKASVASLYVWTYIGLANFPIIKDDTKYNEGKYTYAPPMDVLEFAEDEFLIGNKDQPLGLEYFRRIPGFCQYIISPNGLIFNIDRYKFLHRSYNHANYLTATLTDDNGFRSPRKVHRLVYLTYIGPLNDSDVVDHKNDIRWDNNYHNLEAMHQADNVVKVYGKNYSYKDVIWDPSDIDAICKMIADGAYTKDIYKATKNQYNRDYDKGYLNDLIYNIRTGKAFQDVMLKYVKSLDEIPYVDFKTDANKFNRHSEVYVDPPEKIVRAYKEKQYRLNPRDVEEIRKRRAAGEAAKDIAKDFGIKRDYVYALSSNYANTNLWSLYKK